MSAPALTVSDFALAMAVLFVCRAAIQRLTSKGPMLWPVLGLSPSLFANLDNVYEWATGALERAGGSFRYRGVAFGRCSGAVTAVPANIEHMLKTNFTNYPKGSYYRERFAELLGDGIFNADGEAWRAQRRAAAAELHAARFVEFSYESLKSIVHGKLLPAMSHFATVGTAVDLQDMLLRFTFDNICAAAFGVDPGCLAGHATGDVPFAKAFEEATECSLFRFVVPPFVWKPMRRLDVGSEKRLKRAVRLVHDFAEKTVSDRRDELRKRDGLGQRDDLLSRLMESPANYSDKFLKDFCISFILAGRDTSSVALAWFFWLLSTHRHIESRIVQEIKSVLQQRGAADGDGAVFSVGELQKMEYLHAAILEAMRLYPPVPFDFKQAEEDDVLPDGTPVRAGERVIYSIYSMARCADVWGDDCCEFRPERWLTAGGTFVGEASQFKYTVFNGGPRLCAGKKFAYTQMKMVAASVLLRYRVAVAEEQKVAPKMTTTLYMRNGLVVNFVERT